MSEDLFHDGTFVTTIASYDYLEVTDTQYGTNTGDTLTQLGSVAVGADDTIVFSNNTDTSINIRYTGTNLTSATDTQNIAVLPGGLVRKYGTVGADTWEDITPAYLLGGTYDHIEFTDTTYGTDDSATYPSTQSYTLASDEKINVNNDTSLSVDVRYTGTVFTNDIDTQNTTVPADSIYQKYATIGTNTWEDVTPICVHPDTQIITVNRGMQRIADIRSGDVVYTVAWTDRTKRESEPIVHKAGIVEVVNLVIAYPATNLFIKVSKDAVSSGKPNEDLYIIEGHPIVIQGEEVQPNTILGKRIQHRQLDEPVLTYNLCTKERVAVVMNGIGVITWKKSELDEFSACNAVKIEFK